MESNDYQVALNHLHAISDDPKDGLWFALPDLAASVLLTGRVPTIVDAFRIVPKGQLPGLRTITLRGDGADRSPHPRLLPHRNRRAQAPRLQHRRFRTKSGSGWIRRSRSSPTRRATASSRRCGARKSPKDVPVTCYGIDPEPFTCQRAQSRRARRVLLSAAGLAHYGGGAADAGAAGALRDRSRRHVRDGRYRFHGDRRHAARRPDRVPGRPISQKRASPRSGPCPGRRSMRSPSASSALNPYDRDAIPGSILKIEDDNFDPKTGRQRQLWCLAISAKRYALFLRDRNRRAGAAARGHQQQGRSLLRARPRASAQSHRSAERRSQLDRPGVARDRAPIAGPANEAAGFEKRVAVGRITVSSPAVMKPLEALNAGKPYAKQIKPFNFILSCHVRKLGHPIGADPERFHLIAPYETDPRKWETMRWIDQYSRQALSDQQPRRRTAREPSRASRAMATCCASTSSIPKPSAPMPAARRAESKPLGCSAGGTSRSTSITYIGKESNQARRGRRARPPRSQRRLYRVSRSAARRVGDQMAADPALDAGSEASRQGRIAGHDLRGSIWPGFIREHEGDAS